MIVAQFDSIRHERIYKEFCPKVLRTYESHLTSGNRDTWFTLYLVTFLFLTLVGSASRDRLRHAKQVAGDETQVCPIAPLYLCLIRQLTISRRRGTGPLTTPPRALSKNCRTAVSCSSSTGRTSSAPI